MRHRTFITMAMAFGGLVGLSTCEAQIFRCPNGEGVTFQQGPCNGLAASGGRLIRSADGQTVREPEPPATPASPASASGAAPVPSAGRVYGRTPLPDSKALVTAKSP